VKHQRLIEASTNQRLVEALIREYAHTAIRIRDSYVELIYDRKLRDYYCKILYRCKHNCRWCL